MVVRRIQNVPSYGRRTTSTSCLRLWHPVT
ncbi:MAG: hypothetical protein JWP15_2894, partial [Alphaproteobacteria bacterium]|nr:hypothetical protein [Alphaproteobacteria bacterium]